MNNIKLLYILLCSVFLGTACSKEDTDPLIDGIWKDIESDYINNPTFCTPVSEGLVLPNPYYPVINSNFENFDETIAVLGSMPSCGLLNCFIDIPFSIIYGPPNPYPSDLTSIVVPCCFWESLKGPYKSEDGTMFYIFPGEYIIISELFTRSDCIRIIAEKYARMILDKNTGVEMQRLEMLIASDIFLEKLNNKELKNFMAMALKMNKIRSDGYITDRSIPKYIMTNMMLVSKYEPFKKVFESVEMDDLYIDRVHYICECKSESVEKYAHQFLTNL